jgi:hypothetical protein
VIEAPEAPATQAPTAPATEVVYFSSDNLGPTRAITNSSGASIATYVYDPYGSVTACTGTTVTVAGSNLCTGSVVVSNPLLFTGQYRDDETPLLPPRPLLRTGDCWFCLCRPSHR